MDVTEFFAGVKLRADKEILILRPYDKTVKTGENTYECKLSLKCDFGEFSFRDKIFLSGNSARVEVNCSVLCVSETIIGIGVFCGAFLSGELADLEFFYPSAWYGDSEFFEGKSNKYPFADGIAGGGIDGVGAPIAAAFCQKSKKARSVEALDPAYDTVFSADNVVIDDRITLSSLGIKEEGKTNLLYIAHPATSYHLAGTDRTVEYYLSAKAGKSISLKYRANDYYAADYHDFMKTTWRSVYSIYADINDGVDTDLAREALIRYVKNSFAKVSGTSQYLTCADHFTHESGFLYRNADLAYQMLRYAFAEGDKVAGADAVEVIDEQVRNDFAGEKQVFPFERSRAEGVTAIYESYRFLAKKGVNKPEWLAFVKKEAERFVKTDEYYSIPLLCKTGMIEAAALKAERAWEKFSAMQFYGGIVDFVGDAVLDRESGYLGFYAFLSLYEATWDKVWLGRAAFCADYLETYHVLRKRDFSSYGVTGNEHYNMSSVGNENLRPDGLSFISASCSAGDIMNTLAVPLYLKLAKYSGDTHYADYAALAERNALEYIDLYDKAGSLSDVLLNSGVGYLPEYYQLAVSSDPVCPYRGCAHDATIAWVYYVLLACQQEVFDISGRYFINPSRLEKIELNIAPFCSFITSGGKMPNVNSLNFYDRAEFIAGEELSVRLSSAAEKIVFAHDEQGRVYEYGLTFIGKGGLPLSSEKVNAAARFVSVAIPAETAFISVKFASKVILKQIQIFGECERGKFYDLLSYAENRQKDSLVFSSGFAYSALSEKSLPWKYYYKENDAYLSLYYDDVSNSYRCGKEKFLAIKTGNLVHPGESFPAVRSFIVPADGTYVITDEISAAPYLVKFGGVVVKKIYENEVLLSEKTYVIQKRRTEKTVLKRKIKKGTELYFEIHAAAGNRNCFVCHEIIVRKVNA